MKAGENRLGNDPRTWTIHGITRDANGLYADDQVAAILNNAIEQSAGAFGAHGSPAPLKVRSVPSPRSAM